MKRNIIYCLLAVILMLLFSCTEDRWLYACHDI